MLDPLTTPSRQYSDTVNLDICAKRKLLCSNATSGGCQLPSQNRYFRKTSGYPRATRLYITKILRVDFVHLRKVRHVGNEDVYFDNMLERAARGFENVCQVLQDLMLQQICID
jgi:hypothetical protein